MTSISPEHVEWLTQQLHQRNIPIDRSRLLPIMNDFWSKHTTKLREKGIQTPVINQILNSRLLDMLLSKFQSQNKTESAEGVEVLEQVIQSRRSESTEMRKVPVRNITPAQEWEQNRTNKSNQLQMIGENLAPKTKTLSWAEPIESNNTTPQQMNPSPDMLPSDILIMREKQAQESGMSASFPLISNKNTPAPSTQSQFAYHAGNDVAGIKNARSADVATELRIANTLPKPMGTPIDAYQGSRQQPLPVTIPFASSPQYTPLASDQKIIGNTNNGGQTFVGAIADSGTGERGLLPPELRKQSQGMSREEWNRLAEEQKGLRDGPIYTSTGELSQSSGASARNTQIHEGFVGVERRPVIQAAQETPMGAPVAKNRSTPIHQIPNMGGNGGPQPINADIGMTPITPYAKLDDALPERIRTSAQQTQERESNKTLADPKVDIEKPILPLFKPEYQTHHYYITIDSYFRDLEQFPSPTNFQVYPEEPSDSIELPSRLGPNGVIEYGQPIRYEYTGGFGTKLFRDYKNIVSISCPNAIFPVNTTYVYGRPAYVFNGPVEDQNKVLGANNFSSYQYGPVFQSNQGIIRDILDEPYLVLNVPEIEGLYDGPNESVRNGLAVMVYDTKVPAPRQSPFVHFTTFQGEKKTFAPTSLSTIRTMTLRLLNRTNKLYSVGVDKTYIASITEGDVVATDQCDLPSGTHLTRITIVTSDPEYGPKDLCGADVGPGDLLYFFTKFPCNPESDARTLPSEIQLDLSGYPTAVFSYVSGSVTNVLDASRFLIVGDVIIVNDIYYFSVDAISSNGQQVTVTIRNSGIDPTTITVTKTQILHLRNRGYQSDTCNTFNSLEGVPVVGALTSTSGQNTFQIMYPYEFLPNYLKSPTDGVYQSKDAFFIRQNKQVTYSFEIVTMEPRTDMLTSRLLNDGGMPFPVRS